jgi:hypothetical protein
MIVLSTVGPSMRWLIRAFSPTSESCSSDRASNSLKLRPGSSSIQSVTSASPSLDSAANAAPSGGSSRVQPAGSASE